ncbi:6-bladed beta-propeller [Roseivirga sp.]|uniref:6-bladed beta-propeller n=1 Tax=Roseivirga sp. TaxID=1964215 RepID=UPI003B8BCF16
MEYTFICKRFAILWLSLLCFISCQNEKENIDLVRVSEVDTIRVDFHRKDVLYSEIIQEDVKVLYLKTHESVLFYVTKLVFSEDKIYISDKNNDQIFCFNLAGDLVFNIHKPGYGPEEYVKIDDFGLNNKAQVIEVLDTRRQRVAQYDINTGEFRSAVNYPFYTKTFTPLHGGGRLFHNSSIPNSNFGNSDYDNRMAFVTDSSNNLLKGYFRQSEKGLDKIRLVTQRNIFPSYNSQILNYIPLYTNMAYQPDTMNGLLRPAYFLDFKEKSLKDGVLKSFNQPMGTFDAYIAESGLVYSISNFLEAKNSIYFDFYLSGLKYKTIYEKSTGKSLTYRSLVRGQGNFRIDPVSVYKDYHVTVLSEEQVSSVLSYFENRFSEDQLREISDYQMYKGTARQNVNRNPILIFSKYRSID